jgi:hypothetical protein
MLYMRYVFVPVSIGNAHFRLSSTYKYPMPNIAISVAFVRTLACRVKITGIGSDANSTSVKMLTAARCQYLSREPDTRERTPVGKTNQSVQSGCVASCIFQWWLEFNFPNRSQRQTMKYKRAQTRQSEHEQEHYGHSHISLALQYEITCFLPIRR